MSKIEVLVNDQWVEQEPVFGDWHRKVLDNGHVEFEAVYEPPSKEELAKNWRNSELAATDWVVPLIDHPQHSKYIAYRQALRDWASTPDFPDTPPTLGN
jgi:hypothetical protein